MNTMGYKIYDNGVKHSDFAGNAQIYIIAKLCPEDKAQLDRIEKLLTKKKEYVQLRVNK